MADGKAFSAWLSGDLLTAAEKRADEVADGNTSKYVKSLVERDVATEPATLLVELAKQYHPTLAGDLERALTKTLQSGSAVDGRKVLARFLDAYVAALGDRDFKPEQAFELLSIERRKAFEEVAEDRLEYLARKVAEYQKSASQHAGLDDPTSGQKPRKVEIADFPPTKKTSQSGKKPASVRATTGQPKLQAHSTDQPA